MTPDRLRELTDALVEQRDKAIEKARFYAERNHGEANIERCVAEASAFRLALAFLHISSDGEAGFSMDGQPNPFKVVPIRRGVSV